MRIGLLTPVTSSHMPCQSRNSAAQCEKRNLLFWMDHDGAVLRFFNQVLAGSRCEEPQDFVVARSDIDRTSNCFIDRPPANKPLKSNSFNCHTLICSHQSQVEHRKEVVRPLVDVEEGEDSTLPSKSMRTRVCLMVMYQVIYQDHQVWWKKLTRV